MKPVSDIRVQLTPISANDAAEMFHVVSPAEIYSEMEATPPRSVEELRERYERLQLGESSDEKETWLNWIVRNGEPGEAMGFVQATIDRTSNVALIAYVLNPRFWGKAIASRAVAMMMETLKKDYRVTHFRATVNRTNLRSVALLKRFEFKETSAVPIERGKVELMFEFSTHPCPSEPQKR